ncbi:hypothetical protein TH61_08775 [Rufibacter sp. DG15C]|uniref:hypothetical protein n=1 Tax=Rufibacter sp. DG15C TaxID=1379909 RepID=UPI00078E0985|nr:hypothetical protein [Rufibacter sp. DG15C]AMM51248.1 hypothetical protein TH61_08775 [Rufibacter sp. DG15C]
MTAFVYLNLTEEAPFTYQKPLLTWVKNQFPEVVTFDLDAASDPMLQSHAQRLLQESRFCLLFLKTGQKRTLGSEMKLLDVLFRKQTGAAVANWGQHPALQTVLQARPSIEFAQGATPEDLYPFLASFLGNSLKTNDVQM